MLDSLRGRVLTLVPDLLLAAGPVTFRLEISARTRAALSVGEGETELFVELIVREERMELLGFARAEERELFRLITGVSGVGKRLGLAILSELGVEELAVAVATADVDAFTRVSGVGKKTASRLLLELKGRLDDFQPAYGSADAPGPPARPGQDEALLALTALGMNRQAAEKALAALGEEPLPVEEMIRRALAAVAKA